MTTTIWTRRLHVADHTNGQEPRLRAVLGSCDRLTGLVLAVCCPACHRWVKPARYQPATGTCRRCGRNRHHTPNRGA